MTRFRYGIAALGIVAIIGTTMFGSRVAAQAPAGGQAPPGGGQRAAGPPPAPPKNLQVLPKETTTAQVLPLMRTFAAALGVQCGYCHNWEGPGNAANDMASDAKTPKLVARVMMQMVGDINQKLAANIKKPADQLTQVGCMTCHRGEAIPKLPPPPAAAPARGAPGAGAPGGGAPGGAGGAAPPTGRQ